jgi:hypothetical protein
MRQEKAADDERAEIGDEGDERSDERERLIRVFIETDG